YRAFWFYLLQQGIVRAGTANSDTHTLTENVTGFPRNVVWTDTTRETFDVDVFDADVREGRILGTNGPVIEVSADGQDGPQTPSVRPFRPDEGGDLRIRVRAAPWVPVDEVRIVVNGEVVRTIGDLPATDPFGTDGLDRL